MSFLNDILEYYAEQEPQSRVSQAQIDYINLLLYDLSSPPKQVVQHVAFALSDDLTFERAQALIELLRAFELQPLPGSQKEIAKALEARVMREP